MKSDSDKARKANAAKTPATGQVSHFGLFCGVGVGVSFRVSPKVRHVRIDARVPVMSAGVAAFRSIPWQANPSATAVLVAMQTPTIAATVSR